MAPAVDPGPVTVLPPMSKKTGSLYGAIDLGSNTIRLLVARPSDEGDGLFFYLSRREVTRLAAGLGRRGRLDEGSIRKSLSVLKSYVAEAEDLGAEWIAAVGTGALRDAVDGDRFAERARIETGLHLDIIDQPREAWLTLLGVASVLGQAGEMTAVDIGGWSTEVIRRRPDTAPEIYGLSLGAVGLFEEFIESDPPADEEMKRLALHLGESIGGSDMPDGLPGNVMLVGTGGTFTTLAALDQGLTRYDRDRINGYSLGLDRIMAIQEDLLKKTHRQRENLEGMEPGRADIIISGTSLAAALVGRFKRREIIISDSGILEGCIIAGLRGDPSVAVSPIGRNQNR